MLLQTALYLTSVLSAIALIALILVQDRPDDVRRRFAGLRRATAWSAGIFLLSALGTAAIDGRTSGSLLDELPTASTFEAASSAVAPAVLSPAVISAGNAPVDFELAAGTR